MPEKLLSSRAARCWAWLLGVGLLLAHPVAQAQIPLAGLYTINNALPTGGTNFASFSDAATRLNTDGMNAPVTISVSGGPYTEQLLLNQVVGSSATNTLTINGNGSVIQFAPNATAQRAVVTFNGTDYTTLNNLVITCQAATYGYGVLLTNVADNNRLTNNVINADLASTSSNFAGIVTSGSATLNTTGISANNLLIEGNTINGGYYGINLYGNTTAAPNTGIIVRNNQVRDFYINGIYVGFQEGTQIVSNDVSRPTRSVVGGFNGIWAFGTSRGINIEKNRLHDPFTGNPTATGTSQPIFLATGAGPSATQTNDVVNNVVYNMNGNGVQYGIYNSASPFIRMYNNSFSLDDQTSTATLTTYGIYTNAVNNDVRNNVISITRTGSGLKYALYYTVAGTISNYNNLYVPAGNVGYLTTAFATLAAWQAANGSAFDQNSLSVNPQYSAPATGNLQPLNAALNNTGTPLARVTEDINGTPRSTTTPDMGAYEFTPGNITVDIAAGALLTPAATTACYGAAEAVSVQVRNAGTAALNFAVNPATVTVVITLPGGATQTLTATLTTGTLAAGATQTVTLTGTANLTAVGTYTFAITANVTGDQNSSNNTLAPAPTRTVLAPVGGTLTPGSTILCGNGTATLQVSGTANGTLQYQVSPDGITFTDVPGATAASYTTPVLATATYYRVRVGCNLTTVAYSTTATITVRAPQVATTNGPLTVCAGTPAILTATAAAGGQVRFYAAATGGPALTTATAGSYTTPALTANTTYYAEAYESIPEAVGKPTTNGLDGTAPAGGLYFTATAPTSIVSVTVYRAANAAAGTANIYLLPGSSTTITSAIASLAATVPANASSSVSPTVLTLNFAVPAAGTYTLYLAAATPNLVYDTNTAAPATAFPYASPSGIVSITGSTTPPNYYFFYNWQITGECRAATRTPIQVNVTARPTATLTATTQPSGAVVLTATALSGATYQFFRNGVAVGPASTSSTLTLLSGAQNGTYTVIITAAAGGCDPLPPTALSVTVLGTQPASLAGISLRLYPNPTTSGTLTLELTGPRATAAQLTVVGALGQAVHRGPLAAGTSTLHLPGLAPGVYTLRVQTTEGVLTQRFVRE